METPRKPRIVIENLPVEQPLTEEEMAALLGAGRFRPSLEQLETREVMSANISASLSGGVLHIQDNKATDVIHVRDVNNQISIDGVSIQVGAKAQPWVYASQISIDRLAVNDLVKVDSGAPGGQNPTVASGLVRDYLFQNGRLLEANGKGGWTDIGGASSVAVDKFGQVFFLQGTELLQASGIPSGTFGAYLNRPGVQGLVQGKDATGNPMAYVLSGGTVYPSSNSSYWPSISGNDVRQIAVDASGSLFALRTNETVYRYLGSGNTWQSVSGNNVLHIGVDGNGSLFALGGTGGTVYRYPGSGSTWQTVGTNGFLAGDGSIWFLSTATADTAGDHMIYSLSNGQMQPRYVMSVPIASKWLGMGGPVSSMGLPTSQEPLQWAEDGVGRIVRFQDGSVIYWVPGASSAHLMGAAIYAKWEGANGGLAPASDNALASDEQPAGDGVGRIVTMTNGSVIYWAPGMQSAHLLGANIYGAWQHLGGAKSLLGLPVSDEVVNNNLFTYQETPYVGFQHGGIYWANGKATVLGG